MPYLSLVPLEPITGLWDLCCHQRRHMLNILRQGEQRGKENRSITSTTTVFPPTGERTGQEASRYVHPGYMGLLS